MGIPAFYRWLLERYPQSVVEVNEETPAVINGVTVPIDTSDPNPNGIEFDNLYLDMNGIIHPCFHPEGLPAPETHEEVFKAVFKYIDRIFSIVRPRKLLYMAIDGVAPRAKMNQQRARRFRAAKDAGDEASDTGRIRRNDETEREDLSTKKLDSNVITPGTKFMELLSSALQYYIRLKVNVDSGWQGIKVILSDASVPGEGEHKIMSYIRLQRNLPGFDPNTRHCLYGLDADLIMLALASHEVHFSILREDVRKDKSKYRGQQNRQDMYRQQAGRHSKKGEGGGKDLENLISEQKFQGAIDLLIDVYKKEFVNMGGYLTNSCQVNLERAGHFIQAIGSYENAVFRKRIQVQKHWGIHMQRPTLNLAVQKKQDKSNHVQAKTLSVVDKVKLGEEGWKERYYLEKFDVQTEEDCVKIQRDVVLKYVEGICWVMHYYYQGVCSWQWFYPYHYAPFASDFHDLDRLKIHFTIGKPFKPFDQLMGVLPAASAQALPVSYRKLMTDPLSPILDFYPSDFELDMNGKRHAWQAVCKLPFIEESRLLSEIANVEDTLTVDEKHRNSLGLDMLFVYLSHPLATKILAFCARNKDNPKLPKAKVKRKINPEFSHGMNGFIYLSDKPVCRVEVYPPVEDMDVITDNKVISVFYKVPSFHPHIPRPPKGVTMPRKVISKDGVHPQPLLWHEKTAVAEHRYSRRCIPHNSVSGPRLAKLAHQLVSENCFLKHQVNGDGGNDSHSKKRKKKRSADRKKRTGAERKKRKKQRQDTVVC
ncbi:5'-3' exoribonuclease 4 isoform X4 [Nicotiana tabacum]|uniref:5'-3' exoribonuclease 4 isoform X4 n=2 Tax=Nicotiana tabacum TaxID=4097 RepID=A0AC58TFN8_TOBAC